MKRFAAASLLLLGFAVPAPAQAPPPQAQTYQPGLGDLMTMTVQPRHIKIGIAGQEKNWVYADYELHQLEEAFERTAAVWPAWQSVPVAQMLQADTVAPIVALEAAIQAHDSDKFNAAYKQLTQACDTCHQGAGVGWVVIAVPDASPYADQNLKPTQ